MPAARTLAYMTAVLHSQTCLLLYSVRVKSLLSTAWRAWLVCILIRDSLEAVSRGAV
jgi:hypothetical protein